MSVDFLVNDDNPFCRNSRGRQTKHVLTSTHVVVVFFYPVDNDLVGVQETSEIFVFGRQT